MAILIVAPRSSIATERLPIAQPGEVIIMTATNPDGRLCPLMDCGQGVLTSRIPMDTRLSVLQVYIYKGTMYDVPWYEVEYKGKKGWVSEYLTNRNPDGIGKDFCPRNPKGIFAGCDEQEN